MSRKNLRFHALLAGSLALLVLLMAGTAMAAPAALGFRTGDHGETTRIVLELSEEVPYQVRRLSGPERIAIDFPALDWRIGSNLLRKVSGLVKSAHIEAGATLILELTRAAEPAKIFYLSPSNGTAWRFVMDLSASSGAKATRKTAMASPAGKRAAKSLNKPEKKAPEPPPSPVKAKPVVIIDPGHGGIDPGAVGSSGVYEKNIVLAMGRELKDRLEASGKVKVAMTRDRDVFLKLRDRVAKARAMGADLFISLHANTHPNASLSGLSVYTLSEKASDKEAEQLAESENKADLIAGIDLSNENPEVANILIDLAQRETMNLSAVFAGKAVNDLGQQIKLLTNTHRFAGFAVLKAPDVPSVLVELGYLSNAKEEQELKTKAYRVRLASALSKAVEDYFDQVRRVTSP